MSDHLGERRLQAVPFGLTHGESLVDGHCGCVSAFGSWFVGLDVCAITVCVGDIVDDADSAVGSGQTVAADLVSERVALLVTERATSCAGLVVAERILAEIVLASVLAAGSSVDGCRNGCWSHQVAGRGDGDEASETDEYLQSVGLVS